MNSKNKLNTYNSKFNRSLVGKWVTIEGSFNLLTDSFEFFANGKGIWLCSGTMSSTKFNFEWRESDAFTIEIKLEGDNIWDKIDYNFKEIETDTGNHIVLCQNGSDFFYLATTRIGYSQDV